MLSHTRAHALTTPTHFAGFSLAGGALWASLTFCAAFAFYIATVRGRFGWGSSVGEAWMGGWFGIVAMPGLQPLVAYRPPS